MKSALKSWIGALIIVVTGFVAAGGLVTAQEPAADSLPIIAAGATDDLKAKEGQKIVIHGETTGSGKSQSGTNFVNFKDAEFTLIAFKSDLEPFKDGEPADIYDGKRIAVTGVVSIYQSKPQIKLTSPDQVRILKPDEVFPPKKDESTKAATDEEPTEVAVTEPETVLEPEKPKESPPVDWRNYFR